jgi:ABC-type polysaccharide/polyol phosphate transport system ATPase subunit/SAM-dependent methyltransferase
MSGDEPRTAIRAAGVSKTFRLPHESRTTVREYVLHPLRRTTWESQQALADVSFEIEAGEFFGVIGRNGSGKSTLLKILAGIYRQDSGTVELHGKLSPFIELGVGFNPELNARDNIRINGTLLGLSPDELRLRFDEIIGFAELERFVDQKLKNYSSGMQLRLAYSIAIQVPFDILLLDEVLAVGDQNFQEKCFATFDAMRATGKTVVLVTHGLPMVTRFCDRAMLLRDGAVQLVGHPNDVIEVYLEQETARTVKAVDGGFSRVEGAAVKDAGQKPHARARDATHAIQELPTITRDTIALMGPQQIYDLVRSQNARLDARAAQLQELSGLGQQISANQRTVQSLWTLVDILRRRHYPDFPVPDERLRAATGSGPSELNYLAQGLAASDQAVSTFGQTPSGPVLEWGCGSGRTLRWLLCYPQWVQQYRGCDPDADAVHWLRQQGEFHVQTCASQPPLPYADGEFAGVFALNMLTRIQPDRHAAWYAELARVVQPGARLLIGTFGPGLAAAMANDKNMLDPQLERLGQAYAVTDSGVLLSFVTEAFTREVMTSAFILERYEPEGHGRTDVYLLRRS